MQKAEEPFSAARPVTAQTKRPVPSYFWSRDSHHFLFVQDQAADENYHVYAVDPPEALAPGGGVPKARNLTDAKGIRAFIYNMPKTDQAHIYVGFNDRDKAWHDLYKLNLATGQRTRVRKNTDRVTG